MDPSGTQGLLLISTQERLSGGAFTGNTCSDDCFCPNRTVRDPFFSCRCTNALKQHGKEGGAAGLRAKEGYLSLGKLYASVLWRPFFSAGLLVYVWYVSVDNSGGGDWWYAFNNTSDMMMI